ncbi:MAG TPA: autotransporter domain-containing protein, partial [Xanthobacteraceae bacterium]|nr:autotransporter domain-containing protein [Xanthobacteraceae bacterium]
MSKPAAALVLNDNFNGAGFTVVDTATANQVLTGIDSNNVFSNIVSIDGGSCTGTLINSTTILTAAHCFFSPAPTAPATTPLAASFSPISTVGFNPAGSSVASQTVQPSFIIVNPNYNQGGSSAADIALIILPTPVTGITPVNLLQLSAGSPGFPGAGTPVLIAGYGSRGTGSNPPPSNNLEGDNQRRIGQTTLGGYEAANGLPGVSGTQDVFTAQFRDPANPGKYNFFPGSATTALTSAEAGNAPGDSGGPVFYCPLAGNVGCTPSQLVEIGDLIGGTQPATGGSGKSNGYAEVNSWTPINLFLNWVNGNNSTLAITTAASGNWSAGGTWIGGVAPGTTNMAWINSPANVALDVNATVSSLWLSNGSLSIGAPMTLTATTDTVLNGGTLSVYGTLSTPLLGMTGGVLTGTGTINTAGGTVSNYGGMIMPATLGSTGTPTSTGTLTIQGNYLQSPQTGTLVIMVGGTSASQLSVSGTATITNGTLQVSLIPQTKLVGTTTTYTILTSNALTGTFIIPQTQVSGVIQASATYSPTAVTLTLGRDATYTAEAKTPNAQNFTKALDTGRTQFGLSSGMEQVFADLDDASVGQADAFFNNADADGGPTDVLGNQLLANLATGRMIQGVLDQHLASLRDGTVSLVQNAAGLRQFDFSYGAGVFGFTASPSPGSAAPIPNPIDSGQGLVAASPRATNSAPYAFWLHSLGGWQNLQTDNNAPGMSQSTTGIIGGVDADLPSRLGADIKAGMALSYTTSQLGNIASESGSTDAFRLYVYGTRAFGPAYVTGSLGYGNLQMSTSRMIDTIGLSGLASGATGGSEWTANLDTGYRQTIGRWLLEPSVGLTYMREQRQSFNESGAGALDVDYDASSLNTLRFSAGTRVQGSF